MSHPFTDFYNTIIGDKKSIYYLKYGYLEIKYRKNVDFIFTI